MTIDHDDRFGGFTRADVDRDSCIACGIRLAFAQRAVGADYCPECDPLTDQDRDQAEEASNRA